MSLFNTIKRCANTAVKLPFAMTWDALSLGNMGEGSSTVKVLNEHEDRKRVDEIIEIVERLKEVSK